MIYLPSSPYGNMTICEVYRRRAWRRQARVIIGIAFAAALFIGLYVGV